MTALDLDAPRAQRSRRRSRQVLVGGVPVGGGAPVSVQSMTTTLTADVDATLRQIAELTAAGCDIVRVAVVESALWECSLFEEHGFTDLKISFEHHDPLVMIAAYRLLAARCDYPLHLGVTEAGPPPQGTVTSAVAFGILLDEGIGDTIRVSLSASPVEEVKAGHHILQSLGLRPRQLEIISCPSCGRSQVDVYALTEKVQAAFDGFPHPLRVAVMGCVVNGPGEAHEADLGVSSGNGKRQIFVRGQVITTVPEHHIVETLVDEALTLTGAHEATP